MKRHYTIALVLCLAACAPTAEQQAGALGPGRSALDQRSRDSRIFATTNQALMLQAAIGVLQDTGYVIEETQAAHGVVVASRQRAGLVRLQVVVRPLPERSATIVRATFQHFVPRLGAALPVGVTLDDPALHREFFARLAQSVFLTAQDI